MKDYTLSHKSIVRRSFLWLIIGAIMFYSKESDTTTHNLLVIYCLMSYMFCIYNWVSAGNKLLSMYNLFILYALFSNLGQSILTLLPDTDLFLKIYVKYSYPDICDALRFQGLCIAGLGLGTALYIQRPDNNISLISLQNYFNKREVKKWGGEHSKLLIFFYMQVFS